MPELGLEADGGGGDEVDGGPVLQPPRGSFVYPPRGSFVHPPRGRGCGSELQRVAQSPVRHDVGVSVEDPGDGLAAEDGPGDDAIVHGGAGSGVVPPVPDLVAEPRELPEDTVTCQDDSQHQEMQDHPDLTRTRDTGNVTRVVSGGGGYKSLLSDVQSWLSRVHGYK